MITVTLPIEEYKRLKELESYLPKNRLTLVFDKHRIEPLDQLTFNVHGTKKEKDTVVLTTKIGTLKLTRIEDLAILKDYKLVLVKEEKI